MQRFELLLELFEVLALRHQIKHVIDLILVMVVVRQFVNIFEGEVPPEGVGVFEEWKGGLAVIVVAGEEAKRIRDDLLQLVLMFFR